MWVIGCPVCICDNEFLADVSNRPVYYQFDQFTLNTDLPSLETELGPVSLTEKELALFVLLVQAIPAVIGHDEVLASLWPGRVVTQQSVARLVADTRKSLKRAGLAGPAIETCHGRGYRLAAPLARKLASQTPSSAPQKQRRLWPWMLTLLSGISLLGAGWWYWPQPQPLAYSEDHTIEYRILWVDDHPENNRVEADHLRSLGYGVHQVRDTADAQTLMAIYRFDLLLSDMGRNNNPVAGLELLDALRAENNAMPVLFYTLVVNPPLLNEVQSRGGQGAADTQDALYRKVQALMAAASDS